MNVKIGSLFRPAGSKYISHVYETHMERRKHKGLVEVAVVLYHSGSQVTLEESLALCRRWCQAKGYEFTVDTEIEIMLHTNLTTTIEECGGVAILRDRYIPKVVKNHLTSSGNHG